jgi:beta-lactamase superfamily II metal-dependent hydrolase
MQITELLSSVPIEDKTPTNGSSIAFVLKIKAKLLLFLADSHPGLILKSLVEYQSEGIINFDSIKVSHHGSFNNISLPLLKKIDSRIYIFSTNGNKHNHPDKETIAHIVGRKSEFERKLFFNYKTLNSEYFNNKDWMKTYNYSIHYLNQDHYKISI